MRVLLVDNYDSFTGNLAQLVAMLTGELPRVVKNDEHTVAELIAWRPERVILSPGPGSPAVARDVGVCLALTERLGDVPLLGVCLGHQAIGVCFGGRVVRAPRPVHGKSSPIEHDGRGIFAGVPDRFLAVRYHSLVLDGDRIPPSLRVTARCDGLVMAIEHRTRPIVGVQFHPESIETELGRRLIENFLAPPVRAPAPAPAPAPVPTPAPVAERITTRSVAWVEPEAAFVGLFGGERWAFWLDSAAVGRGRFSYLGASGGEVVRTTGRRIEIDRAGVVEVRDGDPFAAIGERLESRRVDGAGVPFELVSGYVGYLGYELKEFSGGPAGPRAADALPDAQLMLATRFLVFDHQERTVALVGDDVAWGEAIEARLAVIRRDGVAPATAGGADPVDVRMEAVDEARYRDRIARALAAIVAGESYEICLTTQVRAAVAGAAASIDPLALYRALRARNPAPYAAYLRFDECAILSSSPERFVHIGRDRSVESRPIKGTRRRGGDAAADRRLADELATCAKDHAENLMIVDLVRSDLGRVAEIGSVTVPERFVVAAEPTVFQLVSTVRARLAEGVTPIECVRALFPGGSMTGAPKIRTMEIIGALEGAPRGVYAGGLGFLSFDGAVDLAMAIRTVVARPGELSFGVGGAIVADSVPDEEVDEMRAKGEALVAAIRDACRR